MCGFESHLRYIFPPSMFYSVIIPLYNRPDEIQELLESLAQQSYKNFEVIVVEDGSTITSEHIIQAYKSELDIHYFFKPNSGPGPTRNFGFEKARGDFFIMFDSDCIVPPHYLETVNTFIQSYKLDAFGGPDKAHEEFSPLQKAMNYAMTSFLTTGGIRGNSKRIGVFHPRSFNMGFSRKVYEVTHGFELDRLGEDIDLSIRILKNGFLCTLIPEAFVYHKRKNNFRQFLQQTFNFGKTRIDLFLKHPDELKLVHFFPSFFVLYTISIIIITFLPINSIYKIIFASPWILYLLTIILDATIFYKSLYLGVLSMVASVVQLFGYGTGFLYHLFLKIKRVFQTVLQKFSKQ
ncbi:MAG: glycosyltransferase [Bacteroidia bacterium]|nr:glycosyltransferase [Bacteroidia bacterium]MDW8158443.1 glycosyltransferase [Bacteroidia bacterium]